MSKINSKNILLSILYLLVAYSVIAVTYILIKSNDIGYIDTALLMEKYPTAISAREQLNKKSEEWQKNTKTLESELTELNKEMIEKAATWSKSTLAEKQEDFKKKQGEYYRYSQAVSEKASKLEKELFQPVYDEVNIKIAEFANANGYEIILGTLSGGNILYANEATNLTIKFLDSVNAGVK